MAEAQAQVVKLDVPEKIPISFQLGERMIDGVVVKSISFPAFVDCVQSTVNMKSPTTFEGKIKRNRLLKQTTFYIGNAATPVGSDDIVRMPIPAARAIFKKMDELENTLPRGKIIREGDGVDKALTFELGTPIPVGAGKAPIKELEFFAKTYGDIEDVLAANSGLAQTLMLVTTIAKPLGTSLSLLPSWAVSQLTLEDGYAIMLDVLPLFIESPEDS